VCKKVKHHKEILALYRPNPIKVKVKLPKIRMIRMSKRQRRKETLPRVIKLKLSNKVMTMKSFSINLGTHLRIGPNKIIRTVKVKAKAKTDNNKKMKK